MVNNEQAMAMYEDDITYFNQCQAKKENCVIQGKMYTTKPNLPVLIPIILQCHCKTMHCTGPNHGTFPVCKNSNGKFLDDFGNCNCKLCQCQCSKAYNVSFIDHFVQL